MYVVVLKPDKFYTPVSNIFVTLDYVLDNPAARALFMYVLASAGTVVLYFLSHPNCLLSIYDTLPVLAALANSARFDR